MNNTNFYDVVIIGAGPGGLNTALYASRAGLSVAIVEKGAPGGKVVQTSKIENWLGFDLIEGYELATKLYNHAISFGAKHIFGNVQEIVPNYEGKQNFQILIEANEPIIAKNIVIATGMNNREPSFIKNYEKFKYRGISFCATCDGPLFKNQTIVAIGGGNSAVEETAFLSKIVDKVYLIVKDNHFIAEEMLVNDLKKISNVEILMNSNVVELIGENTVEKVVVEKNNGEKIKIKASGLFPFIGFIPNNEIFNKLQITDSSGFVITDENMQTNISGLYAVGDIRQKNVRQIVTAASDGAIAAKHIADKLSI